MHARGLRSWGFFTLCTLTLISGCNRSEDGDGDPAKPQPQQPAADPGAAASPRPEPEPSPQTEPPASARDPATPAATSTGPTDEGEQEGEDDDGEARAQGDEDASDSGPSAAELLQQVRKPTTSDEQAMDALAAAERAGASSRKLAKAANARGEALHATPKRAKEFFEWSAAKWPSYPVPTFNLAKQAVIQGDIPATRRHLKETHERGGHKLLQQIDFDPTWEIVKDDPAVRKLLQ